jgi:O-antigen/teichoic acid export membrane protein
VLAVARARPAIGIGRARRTQFNWIVTGLGAAVNVVLNVLLIPPYGMMGAAIATLAAYAYPFVLLALGFYLPAERARLRRLVPSSR